MKKEDSKVSRRQFLNSGTAAASVALLAAGAGTAKAQADAPPDLKPNALMSNVVYDDAIQTLTNKTISGLDNTIINIGTEYLNIKKYLSPSSGTDITQALTDAINAINQSPSRGGQILVPRGVWTSRGGHSIKNTISIEGVGCNYGADGSGTEIQLVNPTGSQTGSDYLFKIGDGATVYNASLKNMLLNMDGKTVSSSNAAKTGIGLLMTNTNAHRIYGTHVENVGFYNGLFGIKVDSTSGSFECVLNRFDRIMMSCRIGFYCNTINSGFEFNTPYVSLPSGDYDFSSLGILLPPKRATADSDTKAVAFYSYLIGTLTVNNHHVVGQQSPQPTTDFANDGTTLLYTYGGWNAITFQGGGQDENINYLYRSRFDNYGYFRPIVFRNCLIQSKVWVDSPTYFVSDSNSFVNFGHSSISDATDRSSHRKRTFYDNTYGPLKLYFMGKNNVESRNSSQTPAVGYETFKNFIHSSSTFVDPFNAPLGY